jgi:small subunit ribosomal protein S3
MEAGALGAEIVISGKLTTERARFEKFRAGYFPRCGEPALIAMKKAEAHVQLKPGIIGVRVKIMPPDAVFPDRIKICEAAPPEEETIPVTEEAKPVEAQTQQKEEVAEEPTVQAKEVQDEPKGEEAKE